MVKGYVFEAREPDGTVVAESNRFAERKDAQAECEAFVRRMFETNGLRCVGIVKKV